MAAMLTEKQKAQLMLLARVLSEQEKGGLDELKIFENPEFGKVRALEQDGEPWFVAADVCRYLEIKNSRDALSRLDDDEKGVVSTDTLGGKQTLNMTLSSLRAAKCRGLSEGVWGALPPATAVASPSASSQSPLASVSAYGENCARSLAPPFPTKSAILWEPRVPL